MPIILNPDQQRALTDMCSAVAMRRQHVLTGYAGTGKTTVVQEFARELKKWDFPRDGTGNERSDDTIPAQDAFVLTAPTHKACEVLQRKTNAPVRTIHSLLSLRPGKAQGDRRPFVRGPNARPVTENVVVIDEASMLSSDLMDHIDCHLAGRAVILVGDPAQLPPVGEVRSRAFDVMPQTNLRDIVRQAEGNPILRASQMLRDQQGNNRIDWTWAGPAREGNLGIFLPGDNLHGWMRKAFCSDEFADDPDTVRYLCWTNTRVAETNNRIRRWIYGDGVKPGWQPGERMLLRSPWKNPKTDEIVLAINQEVGVLECVPGIDEKLGFDLYHCRVRDDGGMVHEIFVPANGEQFQAACDRVKADALAFKIEWEDYHKFLEEYVRAQHIYAITVHNSQGSTFRRVFVDLPDIRRRARTNVLECLQLLYVACTRPSETLMLAGI